MFFKNIKKGKYSDIEHELNKDLFIIQMKEDKNIIGKIIKIYLKRYDDIQKSIKINEISDSEDEEQYQVESSDDDHDNHDDHHDHHDDNQDDDNQDNHDDDDDDDDE